jgi:hypothetical protein
MLYNAKHDRILKVKYIDWDRSDNKSDKVLKNIVNGCKRYVLHALMGFHHNWNTVILYQFVANYYYETSCDVLHGKAL